MQEIYARKVSSTVSRNQCLTSPMRITSRPIGLMSHVAGELCGLRCPICLMDHTAQPSVSAGQCCHGLWGYRKTISPWMLRNPAHGLNFPMLTEISPTQVRLPPDCPTDTPLFHTSSQRPCPLSV